ncbi:hypothetical protein P8452_61298 [Trifolium repens]|nr:hypothetical protein P8452_61298 [Trifolium repens]
MSDSEVPTDVLTFTDIRVVFINTYDVNYLCHLIGVLCSIDMEPSFEHAGKKGKFNHVELNNNGVKEFEHQFRLFLSHI